MTLAPLQARLCVAPHRVLSTRAVRVRHFDAHLHKTLAVMGATLLKTGGVGIAAPQVGAAIRACIVSYDGLAYTLINPEISWRSPATTRQSEACLSLPRRVYRDVERAEAVRLRYQDERGQRHTLALDGMLARIVQHECDHLDGILVAERVSRSQIITLPPGARLRKSADEKAAEAFSETSQEATNPDEIKADDQ